MNSASVEVIGQLPGSDRALASRIVEVRERVDGFASVEELGMLVDLPGDVVEDLRERVALVRR